MIRAYTGSKGLERARNARPDLVIVDVNLPDMDGLEFCRTVKADPAITSSTPIIVTTASHPTRQLRLRALRAGAWDFLGHPLDAEELVLRLDAFMTAKFDADRARATGMVDDSTGLYNFEGMSRRARELGSQAFRNATALACVAFSVEIGPETDESRIGDAIEILAEAFKKVGRLSDAIGRLSETEFAVLAPATDAEGAVRLANRLARAIEEVKSTVDEGEFGFRLRAGYDAISNFRESPLDPTDLLTRAETALQQAVSAGGGNGDWIRPFGRMLYQN